MRRMPSSSASSSVVALSPAIVQIASPTSTRSPSRFSHSATLPTFMSQPSRGMTTSAGMHLFEHRAIHDVAGYPPAQHRHDMFDRDAPALRAGLDRPARRMRSQDDVVELPQRVVGRQ